MAVAAATVSRSELAGFAREARRARAGAIVIDTIVFSVITAFVNAVYGVTTITSGFVTASGGVYSATTTVPGPWLSLLALIYFFVPEAMFGATPGKALMGLRVVRLDGNSPRVRDVVIRNAVRLIDFLPILYLLGGSLVLGTNGAQRLGDLVAGTTVVRRFRVPSPAATRTSSYSARVYLAAALAVAVVFSAAFDYFGRPPLVVEGLYNTHSLLEFDVTSYSLGRPAWGSGTVTYPITFATAKKSCTGTITLQWESLEWQLRGARYTCPPS